MLSRGVLEHSTPTTSHTTSSEHKHSQPRNGRAGALIAHHPAWSGHHTGGSWSTPTVHLCLVRGSLTTNTAQKCDESTTLIFIQWSKRARLVIFGCTSDWIRLLKRSRQAVPRFEVQLLGHSDHFPARRALHEQDRLHAKRPIRDLVHARVTCGLTMSKRFILDQCVA